MFKVPCEAEVDVWWGINFMLYDDWNMHARRVEPFPQLVLLNEAIKVSRIDAAVVEKGITLHWSSKAVDFLPHAFSFIEKGDRPSFHRLDSFRKLTVALEFVNVRALLFIDKGFESHAH